MYNSLYTKVVTFFIHIHTQVAAIAMVCVSLACRTREGYRHMVRVRVAMVCGCCYPTTRLLDAVSSIVLPFNDQQTLTQNTHNVNSTTSFLFIIYIDDYLR